MAETRIKSSGLSANITVSNLSLAGTTSVSGDIIPTSNNAINLGTPTRRFGSLYLSGNTIDLGGAQITTTTGGDLSFNTSSGNVSITANTVSFLSTVANTTTSEGNVAFSSNITATSVRADAYFYSNGTPFTGSAGSVGYTGSKGDTGLGFTIAKSYLSVSALTADTSPTGIIAGQFAVIETGNVNDADNAKLYLWSGTAYSYVTDLSGAAGITGPAGYAGSAGSAGTTGYTGSVGAAGTNATGTTTFVATGTIASGKTVALNSDGTVSIVQQSDVPLSTGTATLLPSINAKWSTSAGLTDGAMSVLYNSTDNVVYVIYQSSYNSKLTIEIGTISGTTITFGSFSANPDSSNYGSQVSAHWNPTTNKIIIINGTNSYTQAYAVVVTPTAGPGVTWGTWTQLYNGSNLNATDLIYHQSQGSYVFLYDQGLTSGQQYIYGKVLTVSGTSISVGSQTQIVTFYNANLLWHACYNATNSQVIVSYVKQSGGTGSVIPFTVSSTTITPGTSTQFTADYAYSIISAHNSTNNNMVILYGGGSNELYAVAGTISGSTFTFGSRTTIESTGANNGGMSVTYDATAGRYFLVYYKYPTSGYIRDLAISGTTITAGTAISVGTYVYGSSATYVAALQKVLYAYGYYNAGIYAAVATGFVGGATNAGSWIGISSNSASNGGAVSVTTLGGVNTAITGLTTNSTYYLTASGNLSATATSYSKVGIATATNKILITNAAVTGYTGSAGTTGNVGYTGSAGTTGSTGSTGYTGSAGSAGSTGTTGYTGSAGSAGSTGTTGYTGSAGSAGNVGYTGSRGTTAFTAGNTAPSSPSLGDMWYRTTNDVLYRYLNDGTTSYWIDVSGPVNNFGTSATTQAAITLSGAAPGPIIGQSYGGGYYAGSISATGNGVATHYLIVAPKASGSALKSFRTSNSSGDPTSVIDGPTNSSTMNNAGHPAAQFCEELTIGGYSDWYLPARDELKVIYYNLKPNTTASYGNSTNPYAVPPTGAFSTGNPSQTSVSIFQAGGSEALDNSPGYWYYWSSTQSPNGTLATAVNFESGYDDPNNDKINGFVARAVRRVAI